MKNVNELADQLIDLLANAATAPNTPSPYLTGEDLRVRLGIKSIHTLYDVVTRAAVKRVPITYPGSAILRSKENGYRLADKVAAKEFISERSRLRRARTMLARIGIALSASSNGPLSRMVGRQLTAFVASVIEPMLDSMDEIIAEAP